MRKIKSTFHDCFSPAVTYNPKHGFNMRLLYTNVKSCQLPVLRLHICDKDFYYVAMNNTTVVETSFIGIMKPFIQLLCWVLRIFSHETFNMPNTLSNNG